MFWRIAGGPAVFVQQFWEATMREISIFCAIVLFAQRQIVVWRRLAHWQ